MRKVLVPALAASAAVAPAVALAATGESKTQDNVAEAATTPVTPAIEAAARFKLRNARVLEKDARRKELRAKARKRAAARRKAAGARRKAAAASQQAPASGGGGGAGGQLATIRACESGGNYSTNTGNGFYGAYQFTQSTWEAVGGTGNPASASPAEQDRRAAILLQRSGSGQWPVCGR